MNKKIISIASLATLLLLPVVALALNFPAEPTGGITDIKAIIEGVVTMVWWIFLGASVIMFIMAGLAFLTAHGEPAKIAQARQFVIYGAVGVGIAILGFSAVAIITGIIVPLAP